MGNFTNEFMVKKETDKYTILVYVEMLSPVENFTFYNLTIGPASSWVMNNFEEYTNDEISVKINPWHKYPQKKGLGHSFWERIDTRN